MHILTLPSCPNYTSHVTPSSQPSSAAARPLRHPRLRDALPAPYFFNNNNQHHSLYANTYNHSSQSSWPLNTCSSTSNPPTDRQFHNHPRSWHIHNLRPRDRGRPQKGRPSISSNFVLNPEHVVTRGTQHKETKTVIDFPFSMCVTLSHLFVSRPNYGFGAKSS